VSTEKHQVIAESAHEGLMKDLNSKPLQLILHDKSNAFLFLPEWRVKSLGLRLFQETLVSMLQLPIWRESPVDQQDVLQDWNRLYE
jgi:hypothetical protein